MVPAAAAASPDPVQVLADQLTQSGVVGFQARITKDGRARTVTAGTAELGRRRPVPAGSAFRTGSITKVFVSTVVLQLVGEGRIGLDAPVSRYLPGVVDDRITVRMLLQHTSGLHNYTDDIATEGADFLKIRFQHHTEAGFVADAAARPLIFAPGTSWSYSNTNYMALGMLIQQVTGHDWGVEVTRRIVRPLGLRDTYAPGDSPVIRGRHMHSYTPVNGRPVDVTAINPTIAGASGAIVTTTADLDKLLTGLTGGRLLAAAQFAAMRQVLPNSEGYGLGFQTQQLSCGTEVWGHAGGIIGFTSYAVTTLDGSRRLELAVTPYGAGDEANRIFLTLIDTAICG